jgi:hypothetical protein
MVDARQLHTDAVIRRTTSDRNMIRNLPRFLAILRSPASQQKKKRNAKIKDTLN